MLPKQGHRIIHSIYSIWLTAILSILCFSACQRPDRNEIDRLNSKSYYYHYRNIDSTQAYAQHALTLANDYNEGRAEALNNLAFVSIVRMEYDKAHQFLDSIDTDNQVELLVADVQRMRMCQRQSQNKSFYDYREQALRRLHRIEEERQQLNDHQQLRLVYAQTEFAIVASSYFYYVGLQEPSTQAINDIDPHGEIVRDTAQLLNYFYNIGSGGIIHGESQDEVNQQEFDYLMRCYMIASQGDYPFFQAQAMQAMSEHLMNEEHRDKLIADNLPAMKYINPDMMPDSLLAGNLAQRALDIFSSYGDVYQTAGGYRTLAECFWAIGDYQSAEICLRNALTKDTIINRAPDLVASIREQLCLVYSAVDDKVNSDRNRNVYLDLQEQTRQDRQLEARAEQLDRSSRQLNYMIAAVVAMIVLVCLLLLVFDRMRKQSNKRFSMDKLLEPLNQWRQENELLIASAKEEHEEINEQIELERAHLLTNKELNLEQRAKVSLVNTIMPFIDRMLHEVKQLINKQESAEQRKERYAYISELTEQINKDNDALTRWIQMRQGELKLRIESFKLQSLFDILAKGRTPFNMKGVELEIKSTESVVKADKTLTLFMLNTLADNARKYTEKGGKVSIAANEKQQYVEISIKDTGIGMTPEQVEHLFDYKPIMDEQGVPHTSFGQQKSHGFGLVNCKGIIEKYKKTSQLFSQCTLGVESKEGEGSRFFFRLPKGITRAIVALLFLSTSYSTLFAQNATSNQDTSENVVKAGAFADSAYFSNIAGTYERTLIFADSCRYYLNRHYKAENPQGSDLMEAYSTTTALPAEIKWLYDSLQTNYEIILDIRNESAVAALALHEWNLYHYNNTVYTRLFRELSADNTLENYCRVMQRSETNKNVAITLLVILLVLIFPAYYLLYYRHQLYYRYCIERVNGINGVLLSDLEPSEKLKVIEGVTGVKGVAGIAGGESALIPNLSSLNKVVDEIRHALKESIEAAQLQAMTIEMAEDELHKIQFENARLHISNSVLDNCLSTLKHETMYYPSRIASLIDGTDNNLQAISELTAYYKELYSVLSEQANWQVETVARLDIDMVRYLFELLRRLNGNEKQELQVGESNDKYVEIKVPMPKAGISKTQCETLFTPSTPDMRYMVCRQIVREVGEATASRGCGIQAVWDDKQNIPIVEIKLTDKIWRTLKS